MTTIIEIVLERSRSLPEDSSMEKQNYSSKNDPKEVFPLLPEDDSLNVLGSDNGISRQKSDSLVQKAFEKSIDNNANEFQFHSGTRVQCLVIRLSE